MKTRDFCAVMSAWLRLPIEDISCVMPALRAQGLLPPAGGLLDTGHAACAVLALMRRSLGGCNASGLVAVPGMSLESVPGRDPLDAMAREPFCQMVGQTASALSMNGYLNLGQTLAVALLRQEDNLGVVTLGQVALRLHGHSLVGVVQALTPLGARLEWTFSLDGRPAPRSGMLREVSIEGSVLSGLAYVLAADRTRVLARMPTVVDAQPVEADLHAGLQPGQGASWSGSDRIAAPDHDAGQSWMPD